MQVKMITIFFFVFGVCIAQEDENCPTFVTWKRNATVKDVNYLITPIPYVIISETGDFVECGNRTQFLIGGDGSVFEGGGWIREGDHAPGYNKKSIGIAFIGTYAEKSASGKMLEAAHKLILCGKSQGMLRDNVRVIGARQVGGDGGPGFRLYQQIQTWPEWVYIP